MLFNPANLLYFLPCRVPISDCHYVTGFNIAVFSNLVCVEKALTNLTCFCNDVIPRDST